MAFLGTQIDLHRGGISSATNNVHHPPGWCDGHHTEPEHPPHTSLLVERKETVMNPISIYLGII